MIKKIITLGPEFSYSYNVATKQYPRRKIVLVNSVEEVFQKLDKNSRGIVPIENMLNGSVRETFLSLQKYKAHIFRGFDYEIRHLLAGQNKKFKTVRSHPQALAQCSDYLNKLREKGIEILETSSTARAMEMAVNDKTVVAIGNGEARENYGLQILKRRISNKKYNLTRFVEIGLDDFKISGDKTSLIITPQTDRAGLLFEILSVFKIKDLNLSKIESIPTGRKMNDYIFYLDVETELGNKKMQDALEFLYSFVQVDILGSYKIL